MDITRRLKKAWPVYLWTSSFLFGTNEFIHSFYTYRKQELQRYINHNINTGASEIREINFTSCKKATPIFFYGLILGPIFPVLYVAGFRALDWTLCPYMK
jgi:hypothetical protein